MSVASPTIAPFTIARIETFVFRVPIEKPVVAAFGTFTDRVAALVRVEDRDGAHGWGEIWSNFPSYGAEHRARVLHAAVAPRALRQTVNDPAALWRALSAATHVWAVQSGEPGPLSAALAGLDQAVWDLAARRAGKPLCALLGGMPGAVPVYASGLNPGDGPAIVDRKRSEGYRAFKQKIGFGEDTDLGNLKTLHQMLGDSERLMVDVNQGWGVEEAVRIAPVMAEFALDWVEEPIVADRPEVEWRTCAAAYDVPLAGGENLRGGELIAAARGGVLQVIQPDIGKWGGVSGCVAVGRAAVDAGKRYCPHWLSGGVGLMQSAQVLAAVGGAGRLEVDANDNPLRSALVSLPPLRDGSLPIPTAAGIGIEPDLVSCGRWLTDRRESH